MVVTLIIFLLFFFYNRYLVKIRIEEYDRMEQLKDLEIQRLRTEMAEDFHDEMGNHLASIISLTNVLKINLNNSDNGIENHKILKRIQDSTRYLFKGTREFIWSLDPENDNLKEVLIYIRDYGLNYFFGTSIQFKADDDLLKKTDGYQFPVGVGRQIVYIFKEVMTNCLRHSEASNAFLKIKREQEGLFIISFMDDGKGMLKEKLKGRGLKNINKRAEKIKSTVNFSKINGGGTKVSLHLSLNNSYIKTT